MDKQLYEYIKNLEEKIKKLESMDTAIKICKNCKYFHQHFIKLQNVFEWVNCGHCVEPRIKERKPNTYACKHFVSK